MKPKIAELTCRQTTYIVCGGRDAPITEEERQQLAHHLQGCTYCTAAAAQFAAVFAQIDVFLGKDGG